MLLLALVAHADETLLLEGEAPDDGVAHFLVPFEVPDGVAEVQVQLTAGSDANVLDWGVLDPAGWRGWGGGNTEAAVLNADAASRSYVPGEVAAGTWNVVVGEAKIVDAPATYAIEVILRDAITLPAQTDRAPWVPPPALEEGDRWYAGDLHVHSRESGDAAATFDEIADLARERGLDFVVITDHNTIAHHDQLVAAQARHPDVLLIPGMEFTTYAGHANVLGATGWLDHRIGSTGTIEAMAAEVEAAGALLSINHPTLDLGGFCIGCAWEHEIPDTLAAVEIATGIGATTGTAIAFWDAICADGARVAAVGGSDDHRAGQDTGPFASPIGSPTTLVRADALSVEAILAGIAAERTVVKLAGPEDPMVELASDAGDPVRADANARSVTATVEGGVGLDLVFVVDGERQEPIPVDADPFEATLTLDPADEPRVRAELHADGVPRTVTSHVWLAPPDPDAPPVADEGGCGCGGGSKAAFLPLLLLVRRRGRATAASRP